MKYHLPILFGIIAFASMNVVVVTAEENTGPTPSAKAAATVGGPSGLRLEIVPDGFQLEWNLSPQDPGAVNGYEIIRADRFSGPYDRVATVGKGVSRYIDMTASPEIIYFYKVRAIAGTGSSEFSNTVTGEH